MRKEIDTRKKKNTERWMRRLGNLAETD